LKSETSWVIGYVVRRMKSFSPLLVEMKPPKMLFWMV
jgi:hypothetical protein